MTRDETIALFEACEAKRAEALKAGKSYGEAHEAHWNEWAEPLLAERKAMEADGRWAAENDGIGNLKPKNESTRDFLARAEADFSRCLILVRSLGGGGESAKQIKDKPKSETQPVKPLYAEGNQIDFSDFVFPANISFNGVTFSGFALFNGVTFRGRAWFDGATFSNNASFGSTTFIGNTWFVGATFGLTYFDDATFSGNTWFDGATFSDDVLFNGAAFNARASFNGAIFSASTWFERATFSGDGGFGDARFKGNADFTGVTFTGVTSFGGATFHRNARFERALFAADVRFRRVTFAGNAFLEDTTFWQAASFSLARFAQFATFKGAHFHGGANFNAIRGERAFTMADATFEEVPDFIQAHFEEAPRLDNVHVTGRMIEPYPPLQTKDGKEPTRRERMQWTIRRWRSWPRRLKAGLIRRIIHAERDIPARYRALKRLAIQGHDSDREAEFFSGEVRMARFAGDWPLPWPILSLKAWGGVLRFWAGLAYQVFSNIGGSVARPAAWWAAAIVAAAIFYLGQQPGMAEKRAAYEVRGAWAIWAYPRTFWDAARDGRPCYVPPKPRVLGRHSRTKRWLFDPRWPNPTSDPRVGALSQSVREQTGAVNEAFHLALRNAFIIVDGGENAAHRTYGCLYGLEIYGDNPVPVVPSAVSYISALQKIFAGVMIFLFGLALRNMLKMK
jgi:hypothetical protein